MTNEGLSKVTSVSYHLRDCTHLQSLLHDAERHSTLVNYAFQGRKLFPGIPKTTHIRFPVSMGNLSNGDPTMLESNSAASVSPNVKFELENGATFTFNFQMDGRVTVVGFQDGRAVTGSLDADEVAHLRDALSFYLDKRK
jgi:hypothetical protein